MRIRLSFSLLCPLATTNLLLSLSMDLPVLDISLSKWIDLVQDLGIWLFSRSILLCYIYPLYGYIIFSFTHSSIDGNWVGSTLGPLWIMLLCRLMFKLLRDCTFLYPLGYIVRAKLLGHTITLYFTCWIVFQSDCTILHSHRQCEGSSFPISLPTLVVVLFFF